MKKWMLVGFSILNWLTSGAQEDFNYKLLRQDEDYVFLKSDTSRTWYKKMKYASLGRNDNYLSIGGDVRYQFFYFRNENWGESSNDKDAYIFSRFIAHADLHIGAYFRTFVQLQSSLATGKTSTSPVDENALDLQQAFFDFYIPARRAGRFNIRIGRQELSYGAQRLVTAGEGPNNRQAFDAVKINFTYRDLNTDFFYSHRVQDYKGVFDDGFNKDVKFFGNYTTSQNIPVLNNVDVYYLGLWRRSATFDDGEGTELRHTIGSRIWGTSLNWRYDFEGAYQFGQFANKQISAWTISSNTGYKINSITLKPELGLKTELISGDKYYGDAHLQTFNPLFPRGAYFGLAALIGPANLFDIHPSLTITLIENKLTGTIDYDAFWRFSLNDGLYAPNVAVIYSGKNSRSSFIGHQILLHLDYAPNSSLSFTSELTWFHADRYLKEVSPGKDILFCGLTAQLKF